MNPWNVLKDQFQLECIEEHAAFAQFVLPDPNQLQAVCHFLKTDAALDMDYLKYLTAIDWETHFEMVYHMFSYPHEKAMTLRFEINRDQPTLDSVSTVWAAANWHERECYDLFGIDFRGHPNLKRLLLPSDWEGHPLRKDYVQSDFAQGVSTKRVYKTELPGIDS